jgi:hypothetical protein
MKSQAQLHAAGRPAGISSVAHRRLIRVVAGTLVSLATATTIYSAEPKPAKEPAPVTLDSESAGLVNWVSLSVGKAKVDGRESAFQQRVGLPANTTFGGLEDFHYENAVTKKSLLKLEGHGLLGHRDRDMKIDLATEERGFLRGGYKESRTFYNGNGGYFPGATTWSPTRDSELFADRGKVWFEAGLLGTNKPLVRLKYSHDVQDGRKDSTIWGRINTAVGPRGVGAAFHDLDDRRDSVEGEFSHTMGKTQFGVRLNWEQSDRKNSLNFQDFPGTANAYVTQKETVSGEQSSFNVWSSTWFSDTTSFSSDYRYTNSDADLAGSRIYGNQFDSAYNRTGLRGPGYTNLSGTSFFDQHVVHFGFTYAPTKSLVLISGFKFSYQDKNAVGQYLPFNPSVNSGTSLGPIIIPNPKATGLVAVDSSSDQTGVGPQLELRSTHLTNWLLYVRGEWEVASGNLKESSRPLDTGVLSSPPDTNFKRDTDNDRLLQRYTVGATWHPARALRLNARYDLKIRQSEYDHLLDSTINASTSFDRYPAYLRENQYAPHTLSLRATWQPNPALTSVTRYDYKIATARTRADLLSAVDSAEQTAHIVSQSFSWQPHRRLYVHSSFNYVLDDVTTPVDGLSTSPGPVQKAQNDYWFGNLGAGYALAKKTDLKLDLSYYRSNNYDPSYAQFGLPLGTSARERLGAVSIVQRINRHLRITLRYSYERAEDQNFGGGNNFEARMASALVRLDF